MHKSFFFFFFGEKCIKNVLYKNFSQTKVVTNHNMQLLEQKRFWSPQGLGLCPNCTILFFFGEKCLKNVLYKISLQTKVVTNQKPQLLCYVTFSDILRNFGVIAAYGTHRKSFVPSHGTDFTFSTIRSIKYCIGPKKRN